MTYHTTNSSLNRINLLAKKVIGGFMIVLFAVGHPAFAQASLNETSTAMIMAPVAAIVSAEPEAIIAEETTPAVQPTVQDVLLNVCESNGYGQECAQTLLGMLWNESSNRSTVIGDGGKARGYFQIHYKLHKISIACAEDLVCSANWTIDYLESNSYPRYVSYAVQCHNSCNVNNGYAAKAFANGKRFWNQPLEITQAAPIVLAVK